MTQFKMWFQANKRLTEALLLLCYFSINGIVNATTVLMHDMRDNLNSFAMWEPFVWELSSGYSTVLLIPVIAWFTKKCPWQWHNNLNAFLGYFCAAILFCFAHVFLMVALREFAYLFSASEYSFADNLSAFLFELLYELRKDVWSFFFFVVCIHVYRYALTQWLGDTAPIADFSTNKNDPTQSSKSNVEKMPAKLLVRKLGKEFLINTCDIEWVQSSGNYLNLHVAGDIYPMRITLSVFCDKAQPYGFIRTHRSQAINCHFIKHIETLASGDGVIETHANDKIKLSRRYKTEVQQAISELTNN